MAAQPRVRVRVAASVGDAAAGGLRRGATGKCALATLGRWGAERDVTRRGPMAMGARHYCPVCALTPILLTVPPAVPERLVLLTGRPKTRSANRAQDIRTTRSSLSRPASVWRLPVTNELRCNSRPPAFLRRLRGCQGRSAAPSYHPEARPARRRALLCRRWRR
jgi:hypothetical protein